MLIPLDSRTIPTFERSNSFRNSCQTLTTRSRQTRRLRLSVDGPVGFGRRRADIRCSQKPIWPATCAFALAIGTPSPPPRPLKSDRSAITLWLGQQSEPFTLRLLGASNGAVHRITRCGGTNRRALHWFGRVFHIHFAPDAEHVPIEFKMPKVTDIGRSPQ
jgi:hypothetical protein